jgi:hypothetical protein
MLATLPTDMTLVKGAPVATVMPVAAHEGAH